MTNKEALKIVHECRDHKDKSFYTALRHKARWEHMSLMAVVLEWGDPRHWQLGRHDA